MIEFLVIVYLTFADGSVVAYNDGKWNTTSTFTECQQKVNEAAEELREMYKDGVKDEEGKKIEPSTFIKMCAEKKRE